VASGSNGPALPDSRAVRSSEEAPESRLRCRVVCCHRQALVEAYKKTVAQQDEPPAPGPDDEDGVRRPITRARDAFILGSFAIRGRTFGNPSPPSSS
jgi:hypothetical protein